MKLFVNIELFITLYLIILSWSGFIICQNYEAFDDSVLFRMQWRGKPKLNTDNPLYERILMKSTNNEDFDCYIPFSNKIKEEVGKYDGPSALTLLMPLFRRKTCATRMDTYWIYELCHGRHIRQYHEERENSGWPPQEYTLGTTSLEKIEEIKPEYNVSETIIDGTRTPFFVIEYTDGTICDITGEPRKTRVLYVCHEDGRHSIARIKEISSCVYEIIVLTSHLCPHPTFRPHDSSQTNLHCVSRLPNVHRPKRLLDLEVESQKLRTQNAEVSTYIKDNIIGFKFKDEDEDKSVDDSSWVSRRIEFPNHSSVDEKLTRELLSGEYCLEGGTGWWTFQFCYGKSVRQYHKYEDGSKVSVLLGTFDLSNHKNWILERDSRLFKEGRPSISHFYSNGDYCSQSSKHRQVEVRLKCTTKQSPNAVTIYLTELTVCNYTLHVESPLICQLMKTADTFGMQSSDRIHSGKQDRKRIIESGNQKGDKTEKEYIEN